MHSQAVSSALTRLGTHHTGLITAEDQALGAAQEVSSWTGLQHLPWAALGRERGWEV